MGLVWVCAVVPSFLLSRCPLSLPPSLRSEPPQRNAKPAAVWLQQPVGPGSGWLAGGRRLHVICSLVPWPCRPHPTLKTQTLG
jgi:hypothetical protein